MVTCIDGVPADQWPPKTTAAPSSFDTKPTPARPGWQCPRCNAGVSPDEVQCPNCWPTVHIPSIWTLPLEEPTGYTVTCSDNPNLIYVNAEGEIMSASGPKPNQIQTEIGRMEDLLQLLRTHVVEMEKILNPVLRKPDEPDAEKEGVRPDLVPLAETLYGKNSILSGVVNAIANMSTRLEL